MDKHELEELIFRFIEEVKYHQNNGHCHLSTGFILDFFNDYIKGYFI